MSEVSFQNIGFVAQNTEVTNPAAAVAAGGSLAASTTYYYKITTVTGIGQTTGSSEVSDTTTSTNKTINLTWTEVSDESSAILYRVYRGTASGTYSGYFNVEIGETSFSDDGTEALITTDPSELFGGDIPVIDTSAGSIFGGTTPINVVGGFGDNVTVGLLDERPSTIETYATNRLEETAIDNVNTTFVDYLTLDIDRSGQSGSKTFIVIGTVSAAAASSTSVGIEFEINGTAYTALGDGSNLLLADAGGLGFVYTFVKRIALTAAAHTVKIQYKTGSATQDIKLSSASITVFEEPTGTQASESESISVSGATTTEITKATLTFTPASTQDYLLLCYADVTVENWSLNGTGFKFKHGATELVTKYNGGSTSHDILMDNSNDGRYIPFSGMKVINLANSSQTFTLTYEGGGSSDEAKIGNARIYAVPLGSILNYQAAGESEVAIDNTSYATVLTTTQSLQSGEHTILSFNEISNQDFGEYSISRLSIDSGAQYMTGYQVAGFADSGADDTYFPEMRVYTTTYAAGSKTFVLQGRSETGVATDSGLFRRNRILILDFNRSSGGTTTAGEFKVKDFDNNKDRFGVTKAGVSKLYGDTSGYVGLKAVAAPTSYTLTLPSAVPGGANYQLVSGTDGTMSWAAGITSIVYKGAYDNATDYAVGDSVSYNGSSYVMYINAAAGTLPTDTTKWQVLANIGTTGATGAAGADGVSFTWQGQWLTATAYVENDVVYQLGSSYICVTDHTSGTFATDLSDVKWELAAQKGDTGATGPAGGAPTDGQYITLATNGSLSDERVLTGTANQITVTDGGAGTTATLSTPQNIHTAATPTFAGLTVSGLTEGSIPFAGTGGLLSQDNANLFWDDSNNRLGIGTASPSTKAHVVSTTEQLRLGYDASNYLSTTISSAGTATLATTGTTANITVTAGDAVGGDITLQGGTAAAVAGSTGGAIAIQGRAGTSTGTGGAGGAVDITAGNADGDGTVARAGGRILITAGNAVANTGGSFTMTAGTGGNNSGGTGFTGGAYGMTSGAGGTGTANGGQGGTFTMTGGVGGTGVTGGLGGGMTYTTGAGGVGSTDGGNGGQSLFSGGSGGVGTAGTGGTGGAVFIQGGTGGIGGTTPGSGGTATIRGGAAAAQSGGAAGGVLIQGRDGSTTGTGGNGGNISFTAGNAQGDQTVNRTGGALTINLGGGKGQTGGGAINVNGGSGGLSATGNGTAAATSTWTLSTGGGTARTDSVAGTGGAGSALAVNGGTGGVSSGVNAAANTGGAGGAITLSAGTGGAATNSSVSNTGGAGGLLTIRGGIGGTGATAAGAGGAIVFSTAATTSYTEAIRITNAQNVGIGTGATVSAKAHVIATTEQLRVGYDASNYLSTTISSTGSATLNLTGTSPEFTFSDAVNVPDEAYGSGWNANTEVPTKNAVYDKVETVLAHALKKETGRYYSAPAQGITTRTPTLAENHAIPVYFPDAVTLDRIGVEVTTGGGVGSVLRLGIYNDSGSGRPGTLLLDAGTVASTTTGHKEITISQAITPGLYWLAVAAQVGTVPVLRAFTGTNSLPQPTAPTYIRQCFSHYGVTGAFGTFDTTPDLDAGEAPYVQVRIA